MTKFVAKGNICYCACMRTSPFRKAFAVVFLFALTLSIVPADLKVLAEWREPVRGKRAMVASQHELASKIGVEIMKAGGNAVDAAVAVGLALAVVYPEAGNLGGGGFMLIRDKNGIAHAIDYREMAPKAANHDSMSIRPAI